MTHTNGRRRVVVTGQGVVTPLGTGVEKFWAALKKGECGIREVQSFSTEDLYITIAGEVPDFDAKKYIDEADLGWRQGYIGPGGGVVTERYTVRAYSATFLIGPDQRVLAKNLMGDKLKEAVAAALADEGLFKKQASADSARFPVTRYEPVAEAKSVKPAAIVLDNTDPTFEADKPHHDRLTALDASGKELWSLDGLNSAQTVGGVHGVVFDRRAGAALRARFRRADRGANDEAQNGQHAPRSAVG